MCSSRYSTHVPRSQVSQLGYATGGINGADACPYVRDSSILCSVETMLLRFTMMHIAMMMTIQRS